MAIFEGSFTNASTLKVGIVIARFNDLITNKILSGCLDCLKRHGLDTSELSNQVDIVGFLVLSNCQLQLKLL